jgi:hypothetical protein
MFLWGLFSGLIIGTVGFYLLTDWGNRASKDKIEPLAVRAITPDVKPIIPQSKPAPEGIRKVLHR